eukprot:TRINITY_DN4950_c0_g1_i1.p1 TRINITY_DN4950_c0_g1~~TRINITY_DN4950_c0_g1_i1.p1  ORF type:complete len:311 (+),score=34.99 TRINITY_DN4950_c0_g1_i1:120-1052(+)
MSVNGNASKPLINPRPPRPCGGSAACTARRWGPPSSRLPARPPPRFATASGGRQMKKGIGHAAATPARLAATVNDAGGRRSAARGAPRRGQTGRQRQWAVGGARHSSPAGPADNVAGDGAGGSGDGGAASGANARTSVPRPSLPPFYPPPPPRPPRISVSSPEPLRPVPPAPSHKVANAPVLGVKDAPKVGGVHVAPELQNQEALLGQGGRIVCRLRAVVGGGAEGGQELGFRLAGPRRRRRIVHVVVAVAVVVAIVLVAVQSQELHLHVHVDNSVIVGVKGGGGGVLPLTRRLLGGGRKLRRRYRWRPR